MILNELKNKRILILGFGLEGRDTFLFLRKLFPNKVLGVGDRLKISNFKFQIYLKTIKELNYILVRIISKR